MDSSADNQLVYVYGIVPASAALVSAPDGIDDAAVGGEQAGDLCAIVSRLDASQYSAAAVEESSADVEWLGPRAVAHDRVLTWASDRSAVIPFPMFSLFSGTAAVQRMLTERAGELIAVLERVARGREYALRVFRVDAELLGSVAALSPRLAELAASAASASPGQRYLLDRKLDAEKKTEMRVVSQQIVDEIVADLSTHTIGVVRSPIPRVAEPGASRGTMLLNAAFLVAADAFDVFQKTLTALIERHGPHGFRFDFTGPWPPYHFATSDGDGK
jgi:hypothetical protein